jgi:hypothetical protein
MFKLYTVEQNCLPFRDYQVLLNEFRGAKSVLEIGPGISTLALIEAGVEKIVTLEHDPQWFAKALEKFKDYPQVTVARYADTVPVGADEIAFQDFDVALVDSPKGFTHRVIEALGARKVHPGMEDCSRFNTCLFALEQAPIVYLHDAYRPLERGSLGRLNALGHRSEFIAQTKYGLAKICRKPEPT